MIVIFLLPLKVFTFDCGFNDQNHTYLYAINQLKDQGHKIQQPIDLQYKIHKQKEEGLKKIMQTTVYILKHIFLVKQEDIMTNFLQCIQNQSGNGYLLSPDFINTPLKTDLMIFVTTTKNNESTFHAQAKACILKKSNNRPLFGTINWNYDLLLNYQDPLRFQIYIRIGIHSMFHLMGFSINFIKNNQFQKKIELINNITYVIMNSVKQQVQVYYNCNKGIPLQNKGSGSLSHWEQDVLLDQIMTSEFFFTDYLYVSRITLAFFKDLGLYQNINYDLAQNQFMSFGKGKGCSFLGLENGKYQCKIKPEYCQNQNNNDQNSLISFDNKGKSKCIKNQNSQCKYKIISNNTFCLDSSYNGITGNLMDTLQNGGQNSMAFISNLFKKQYNNTKLSVRCYKAYCAQNNISVIIVIEDFYINCHISGKTIFVDTGQYQGIFQCPQNIQNFCKMRMNCLNHCSGNGYCSKKNCKCYSQQNQGHNCNKGCIQGYFFNNNLNICLKCMNGCIECQDYLNCTICNIKFGFIKVQNFPNLWKCQQCIGNNYIKDGQCLNCNGIKIDHITCQQCPNLYFFNYEQNKCMACSSNCLKCKTSLICLQCQEQYYLQQQQCHLCQGVLTNENICKTCPQSYYYQSTQFRCEACQKGCLKCTSVNICQKCQDHYIFLNGKCRNLYKLYFMNSNNDIYCQNGFYVSQKEPCEKQCPYNTQSNISLKCDICKNNCQDIRKVYLSKVMIIGYDMILQLEFNFKVKYLKSNLKIQQISVIFQQQKIKEKELYKIMNNDCHLIFNQNKINLRIKITEHYFKFNRVFIQFNNLTKFFYQQKSISNNNANKQFHNIFFYKNWYQFEIVGKIFAIISLILSIVSVQLIWKINVATFSQLLFYLILSINQQVSQQFISFLKGFSFANFLYINNLIPNQIQASNFQIMMLTNDGNFLRGTLFCLIFAVLFLLVLIILKKYKIKFKFRQYLLRILSILSTPCIFFGLTQFYFAYINDFSIFLLINIILVIFTFCGIILIFLIFPLYFPQKKQWNIKKRFLNNIHNLIDIFRKTGIFMILIMSQYKKSIIFIQLINLFSTILIYKNFVYTIINLFQFFILIFIVTIKLDKWLYITIALYIGQIIMIIIQTKLKYLKQQKVKKNYSNYMNQQSIDTIF